MIKNIYTVRDEPSESYMALSLDDNDECAMRGFDLAMIKSEVMSFRPSDFSLWFLGTYDTVTGVITGMSPRLIKRGVKNGKSGSAGKKSV